MLTGTCRCRSVQLRPRAKPYNIIKMEKIRLTDYEYIMCVLFSEQSARSQQRIEFGNKNTEKRSIREIREDTLCGKMGEVALSKFLNEEYGLKLSVNFNIYDRGDWDDEDIVVNGITIDVKATQRGKYLLFENNKLNFRTAQNKIPDMIVMCRADIEQLEVEIVGCISIRKLTDENNEKVLRLSAGDCIPGTAARLQADNYCVSFKDLCDVRTAFSFITKRAC